MSPKHAPHSPIRQRNIRPIENGLRQLEVQRLGGYGGRPQCVPDLFAAVEGGRRVPEFVAFAAQLALGQRHIGFPADGFVAERMVLAGRRTGGGGGSASCLGVEAERGD